MIHDLTLFTAVAETGSFTAAARRLGLTTAAISKGIARLESELRLSLLTRTTRRVTLTNAGEQVLVHARNVSTDLEAIRAIGTSATAQPTGRLRVGLPASMGALGRGRYSLTRATVAFAAQYPDIRLETLLSDATADIVADNLDIVVRIAPLIESTLTVRIIAPCPLVLVADAAYTQKHGTPPRIADLGAHAWLGYANHDRPHTLRYRDTDGTPRTLNLTPRFTSNNGDQLITAVLAGLGIAALPHLFIGDDLASNRLIRVCPDIQILPERYLALYAPPGGITTAAARAFSDFMVEWFAACRANS